MTFRRIPRPSLLLAVLGGLLTATPAEAADVFLRCKVVEPAGEKFKVAVGGHIHEANWSLPGQTVEVARDQWSPWVDLTKWPLHGRLNRVGGLAEWPSLKLTLARADGGLPITACTLEVQLADKPEEASVVIAFTEKSGSATIGFLLPHPLREKKSEFETGSQMTARHLAWAREAASRKGTVPFSLRENQDSPQGVSRPILGKFDLITSVWGHYDPVLARQAAETLNLLGFNVITGVPTEVLRDSGMRTYAATWHLVADPEASAASWKKDDGAGIARRLATSEGRWIYEHTAHYVIADEIQTMDLSGVDRAQRNRWFRDYLRRKGENDASLGRPIDGIEYPAEVFREKALPRQADLSTRRIMYYAGKFGQWWTVRQLRQTTDLVKQSFAGLPAGMKTETLPSDHNFFNAWGEPCAGMGYRGLDLFEIGAQEAVDILSAEDWLGLNHMYGPENTWTGGQAFAYLSAIMRSGIAGHNMSLRGLITPSDDGYLRLKAYSAVGQGAKSLFFWTFGPTYIGTENYWSDLRSEYEGIAKLSRALEKSEKVLYPANTVRDPVAVLYSVSHDLWHTDDPASFVENRLTWCALRHLSVQPDFLREEDVEAGRLGDYRVLYITGQCLTRKAAERIDAWVKAGGTVYLSAGAATRDEFYEPYLPPFATAVWPPEAARKMVKESGHRYNERVDLPTIKPLSTARLRSDAAAEPVRVIGCRLDLRDGLDQTAVLAEFADGKPAAARVNYGRGMVVAVGFLPGLAYSPFKVGQTTLDEVWPEAPRKVIALPLSAMVMEQSAVALSEPVVEADLLTGLEGAALVLVNYTYKPIGQLTIRLKSSPTFREAVSTEGVPVTVRRTDRGIELKLPLQWTDIILLPIVSTTKAQRHTEGVGTHHGDTEDTEKKC